MVVQQLWRDDWHSRPTRIEMAPFVRHSGVVEMSASVASRCTCHFTCNCTAPQFMARVEDYRVRTYSFLGDVPGATASYERLGSAYRSARTTY